MRESDKDHLAIVDVLAAFIRLQVSGQTPTTIEKDTVADKRVPVEVKGLYATKRGERPRSLAVR